MAVKAQRGRHLSNTEQQRPPCHPSSSLEESTHSGIFHTKTKATYTPWQKPPSKSSLQSEGSGILALLLLLEEMLCWGCFCPRSPSPLPKTQCHLLDTHVPVKACFGQVWKGEPGGLSRLKRQKLLKEFKSVSREFIIFSGFFLKRFGFTWSGGFDECPRKKCF